VLTGETYSTELPAHFREGVKVVKTSEPRTPKEINEKFPLALSQLIMDCCKSNPNDRPPDVQQVESRLKMVQTLWRQKLEELKARRRAARESKGDAPTCPEQEELTDRSHEQSG